MAVAKHAYAHNNMAPFNQFDVPSTTFALTTKTTTNKLADSNKPKSKSIGTEIIHPIKTVTGMTSKANCVELPIATPMEMSILFFLKHHDMHLAQPTKGNTIVAINAMGTLHWRAAPSIEPTRTSESEAIKPVITLTKSTQKFSSTNRLCARRFISPTRSKPNKMFLSSSPASFLERFGEFLVQYRECTLHGVDSSLRADLR